MKFGFILEHAKEYAVVTMCRVLEASKAGYYAWVIRSMSTCTSVRAKSNAKLTDRIRLIHSESRRTYGSPRIHAELKGCGVNCSRKRVERLMREEGISGKRKLKIRVRTTDSAHAYPVAANVLDRQFSEVKEMDRVWASDITYIPTFEGWLYLATVLDLCSRRVVGWSMKHTLERSIAIDALSMALESRNPLPGTLLHHSDRGSQYACGDYRSLLGFHEITCSMSRVGDCWDNAVAESFFATLKTELIDGVIWQTREHARRAIFEYIEVWYNRERRHSSIGYMSPADYEQKLILQRMEATATATALVA